MKEMVTIGKVTVSISERDAFEIVNLRKKAEEGKKPDDYLYDAARCTAKVILNIITDDVDEHSVVCDTLGKKYKVRLRLVRHEECVGDDIYKCWYDVIWSSADGEIPETVIDLKTRFGYIFEFASTYFSEDLVKRVVEAMSEILGKPEEECTKSEKSYLWEYEID